jgi:hypothetical protein
MMTRKIDTVIRRWCETCQKFTRSEIDAWGYEFCAEHAKLMSDEDW